MGTTNQTSQNLEETLHTGLYGIFKITGIKDVIKSGVFICSIVSTISLLFFVCVTKYDSYSLIKEIKSLCLNILPNILGFTVSGYAIMVGFTQSMMQKKITEKIPNSKYSLYQKISSKFALNIVIQGIVLLIACGIHFIIVINEGGKNPIHLESRYRDIINYIALSFITFGFTLSLFLIIQIVANVFGFSQLIHYFVNTEKIEDPNP
jgi:hypothetical protein